MNNRFYIRWRCFEGSVEALHPEAKSRRKASSPPSPAMQGPGTSSSKQTRLIKSSKINNNRHHHKTTSATTSTKPLSISPDSRTTVSHLDSSSANRLRQTHAFHTAPIAMAASHSAESDLQSTIRQLHQLLQSHNYSQASGLLSRAKILLLKLSALVPSASSSPSSLKLARETLELGALISIAQKDSEAFSKYFFQLQPFYALPEGQLSPQGGNSSKITGLYLLLLLSQGDYAAFHTLLETLESAVPLQGLSGGKSLEDDEFIQYPVRLEQALMEGSYDRVWGETKGNRLPGEEFAVFSEVLVGTIRSEIASCSEKAYPNIPISNAKNLFLLDSEGAVVQFAQQRGWVVKDGRIYFPQQEADLLASEKDILSTSDTVIENTLGYARVLEMIV